MFQVLIKCCAGLDVHHKIVVVTVLKESDDGNLSKITREYRTFRKDLTAMAQWLKSMDVELCCMESTGVYWKAVYETLEEAELDTIVVNAFHVKNVPGRKTDVQDSEWLAELTRCGLLRASFIPKRDFRELRLLTRYRTKLSSILAGEKNRLHKILVDGGIRLSAVISKLDGVSAQKMIHSLIEEDCLPDDIMRNAQRYIARYPDKAEDLRKALDGRLSDRHRFLLKRILAHMNYVACELQEIDDQIVAAMKPYEEEWQLLQTIPGIDKIGAAIVLTEIGTDMKRFGSKGNLSSLIGICPGNNASAGKKKSGRIRKGNKYLKSFLCEAANSARKSNCQYKGIYHGIKIRRGHKRAIVAVGHKLLEVIYVILKKKEPYRDPDIDYEAIVVSRNAARWLQALKKFGYLEEKQEAA